MTFSHLFGDILFETLISICWRLNAAVTAVVKITRLDFILYCLMCLLYIFWVFSVVLLSSQPHVLIILVRRPFELPSSLLNSPTQTERFYGLNENHHHRVTVDRTLRVSDSRPSAPPCLPRYDDGLGWTGTREGGAAGGETCCEKSRAGTAISWPRAPKRPVPITQTLIFSRSEFLCGCVRYYYCCASCFRTLIIIMIQ